MKNCIACKHFEFDLGWGGTDVTPGESASVECGKGHWDLRGMYAGSNGELFELTNTATTCPDYEVSELAKSKGWTQDAKEAPRFGWLEYGKTFGEFIREGLCTVGTAIYVGDEKILIGDLNDAGGSCDHCTGMARNDIVSHYWPDARASELK